MHKLYLADIAYFMDGMSFPLSIGYMATAVEKFHPDEFDIQLFKDPVLLERAIKSDPPDVLALANYTWNRNANEQFINFTKRISPNTITVMGGPCFARSDLQWRREFLSQQPNLDFYIFGEGEWKFVELLRQLFFAGSLVDTTQNPVKPTAAIVSDGAGCGDDRLPKDVFYYKDGMVYEGTQVLEKADSKKSFLDEIPSPYLTGVLDQFFAVDGLVPMIETVRGCPYACTFCCWGGPEVNRLTDFSTERVLAEIDYIKQRTKSSRLVIADGNFGIKKRDLEIAEYIRKVHDTTGWPNNLFLFFAKNATKRIVSIASIFGDMIRMSVSRQTMNNDVLDNIKRTNIKKEAFDQIQAQSKAMQVDSMVEILYPLPGETRESFVTGLDQLYEEIDISLFEIRMYPVELLPGAEMATFESRQKFSLQSHWRMLPGYNRIFEDVSGCEYQEIITATDTFSQQDFFFVRKLHFLICLFSTYKIYYQVVKLYEKLQTDKGFVLFMCRLLERIELKQTPLFNQFMADFDKAILEELIDPEDYRTNDAYRAFQPGKSHERINIYFILKLLYGGEERHRREFNELITSTFLEFFDCGEQPVRTVIESIEGNFVKFATIAQWQREGVLEERLQEDPHDRFVIDDFIKLYDGDLLMTVDKVSRRIYPGALGKVCLKHWDFKRDIDELSESDEVDSTLIIENQSKIIERQALRPD